MIMQKGVQTPWPEILPLDPAGDYAPRTPVIGTPSALTMCRKTLALDLLVVVGCDSI